VADLCEDCGHPLPNSVPCFYCTNCGHPVRKAAGSNKIASNVITLPEQTHKIDLSEYVSDYCKVSEEEGDDEPQAAEIAAAYIGSTYGAQLSDDDFRNVLKHWTPQVEYYLA
jgi:hypothetical protein